MDDVKRALHRPFAVYFVLDAGFDRALFDQCLSSLERLCRSVKDVSRDSYWQAIEQRLAGRSSWSSVAPDSSAQTVRNVLEVRPYSGYERDGVTYTLDVFCPTDVGVSYAGDDRAVVALLFAASAPEGPNFHYADPPESFFGTVGALATDLKARDVCGTFSLATVVVAAFEGRLRRSTSPWSLLYPLTVIDERSLVGPIGSLVQVCHLVKRLPGGRLLLQPLTGFDPGLSRTYQQVAELVQRTPWTFYTQGADAPDTHESRADWPTPVRAGVAPTSAELVASGNPALIRQGLYQIQVAAMLQQRGHRVAAVQVPVVGEGLRVTVPVVLARSDGPDGCVYTQCEEWTPDRVRALERWVDELHTESDSPVIVVSREPPSAIARIAGIAEIIEFPYDRLP